MLQDVFGGKLKLVAHRVKELTHSLLSADYPAEGFIFDTAHCRRSALAYGRQL